MQTVQWRGILISNNFLILFSLTLLSVSDVGSLISSREFTILFCNYCFSQNIHMMEIMNMRGNFIRFAFVRTRSNCVLGFSLVLITKLEWNIFVKLYLLLFLRKIRNCYYEDLGWNEGQSKTSNLICCVKIQ